MPDGQKTILRVSPVFIPPSAHPIPNRAWENPFPPLAGDGAPMKKNARIFFMGTREGGRRPEGGEYKTSIYPAWRASTNPVFIPLGGHSQTQYSSRLADTRKPSVYPAWRAPNPESCMGKSLPPLAGEGGRRPEGGNTKPAFIPFGGCLQTQHLSRLAAARKPSVYPAWPLPTNPAFIPLGSCSQTQCLSRLAATHKPSVYPAWRAPNPESCMGKSLPPLAGEGGRRPEGGKYKTSIYPAWRPPANPAFIPLSSCPRIQRLSCLVAFFLLKSPLARAFLVGVKRFTAWRCRSRSGI